MSPDAKERNSRNSCLQLRESDCGNRVDETTNKLNDKERANMEQTERRAIRNVAVSASNEGEQRVRLAAAAVVADFFALSRRIPLA